MSLPRPDIHLRVSPDCMALLRLMSEVEQATVSALAERYLEEVVLESSCFNCSRPPALPAGNRWDGAGSMISSSSLFHWRALPVPIQGRLF